MKISIITVCYNSQQTIQHTFDSVRSQIFDNIELIVIDGGSKDGTLEIIKANSDIISKWITEPDKGLYDAMNKGIKIATGNIIGILNSDDVFFDDNVLIKVAQFHEDNPIQASVGNVVQVNNSKIVRKYSSKYWRPSKLKIGSMPPHPSLFVNKDLFLKFGYYDLTFKSGADYELFIRFFLKNQINFMYSGITTTSMAIGGISSSGMSSYKLITKEIYKSLKMNNINFIPIVIRLRFIWKIWSFIR